jgi:hypothetical protein
MSACGWNFVVSLPPTFVTLLGWYFLPLNRDIKVLGLFLTACARLLPAIWYDACLLLGLHAITGAGMQWLLHYSYRSALRRLSQRDTTSPPKALVDQERCRLKDMQTHLWLGPVAMLSTAMGLTYFQYPR